MPAYAIKNIKPNPFRRSDWWLTDAEKISALRESFRSTGYWGNIIARLVDGVPQIAFGHHRLAALKAEYGKEHKVDLIIKDLTDADMLRMMARENSETWTSSAAVEFATVRAVVEAYAAGKIKLEKPGKKAKKSAIRYAPHFSKGRPHDGDAGPDHPYTARTLGVFVGWLEPSGAPQKKVRTALAALALIEERVLEDRTFFGLTTKQAQAVVEQVRLTQRRRRAPYKKRSKDAEQRERVAWRKARPDDTTDATESNPAALEHAAAVRDKKVADCLVGVSERATWWAGHMVGRTLAKKLREGEIGCRQAAAVAAVVNKRAGEFPNFEAFARSLMDNLAKVLDPDHDERARTLAELVDNRVYLTSATVQAVVEMLRRVGQRFSVAADELERPQRRPAPRTLIGGSSRDLREWQERSHKAFEPATPEPLSADEPANDEPGSAALSV